MIVFNKMVDMEWIEHNPVLTIKKMKTTRTIRKTLSPTERLKIDKHLRENYYSFWLFLQIFFHAGCRETEMVRIKGKDVDLERQQVKVLIK